MKLVHLLLAACIASTLIVGIVAPFPGKDPRSVFNPFIIPVWDLFSREVQ
jgi:hypothetical protein